MLFRIPAHAVLALALLSVPAFGQAGGSQPTRFTVGGAFMIAQPKEEFRDNVDTGYGGGGSVLYHLTRSGLFSVGFDGYGFLYGREQKRVPFSETVGGRILVDVTTTNSIAGFSFGPELARPGGIVRPYINVGYSRLFFRTTSSVRGIRDSDEPIAGNTNHSDGTGAWAYGAGLRIPLGRRESPVLLDAGVRYQRGGTASYLREGSIQDNPDGSITITPLVSKTPFMVYTIGVRFRIPYSSLDPCPRLLC